MNHRSAFSCSLMMAVALSLASTLCAQDSASNQTIENTFAYTPPMRGAPAARTSGGTRGSADTQPVLFALTPDHAAQTTLAQPTLMWYLSEPTPFKFELAMTPQEDFEPVLEWDFVQPKEAGVLQIDLSKHQVKLQPGVKYQWVIAVIPDPAHRSKDVSASGYIECIEPSEELSAQLANANELQRAAIYLQHGIWYDALATLSRLVDANPTDTKLRSIRADVLEQVGLSVAASYDREQIARK